jgi:hypothetical protein
MKYRPDAHLLLPFLLLAILALSPVGCGEQEAQRVPEKDRYYDDAGELITVVHPELWNCTPLLENTDDYPAHGQCIHIGATRADIIYINVFSSAAIVASTELEYQYYGEAGDPELRELTEEVLSMFDDEFARADMFDLVNSGVSSEERFLVGPDWVICCDRPALEDLQRQIGGSLVFSVPALFAKAPEAHWKHAVQP